MRVELSPFVESDLEAVADYIAQDSPARAVDFVRQIREKVTAIGNNPLIDQLRPKIGEDARMAMVGRYVVLFRVAAQTVRIERVAYGRPRPSRCLQWSRPAVSLARGRRPARRPALSGPIPAVAGCD